MTSWIRALLANIFIALILILLIIILKRFKQHILKYLNFLIALTVGILLGMVFLKFIPEVLEL
ncbi:MAG: hypothetical protein GXP45_04450 [bacterium]|nr:hypothetical protein [bacterium]